MVFDNQKQCISIEYDLLTNNYIELENLLIKQGIYQKDSIKLKRLRYGTTILIPLPEIIFLHHQRAAVTNRHAVGKQEEHKGRVLNSIHMPT